MSLERNVIMAVDVVRVGFHSLCSLNTGLVATGSVVSETFNRHVAALGGDEITVAIISGLLSFGFMAAAVDGAIDLKTVVSQPDYPEVNQ